MNIISNPDFAIVQKTISVLAENNSHWFPDGFKGIHTVDHTDMFASYHQGRFYFSNQDRLVKGFAPALELTKAIEKINAGQTLTFNEEYAVETLWHEMMHGRALHAELPKNKNALLSIEAIHQWQSRRTYQNLLAALKIKAVHQEAIIHTGLAYQTEVVNFGVLLELIKLSNEDELINAIQTIWLSKISAQQAKSEVTQLLAEKTGLKESRIAKALNYLSEMQSDFKAKAQRIFSY